MIVRITDVRITRYEDNGQTIAYVDWIDQRGKTGTTSGDPDGLHMGSLLARAKRDGIAICYPRPGMR